jgi:ABC-2 type transport system ATP-binding protein
LILDEPEAGLDPQSRILVRDFIKGLAKEKTIILTTHNMDEADRLSDRVAIIDKGKLLLVDTPRKLKKSVGEGDLLEIILSEVEPQKLQPVIDQFAQQFTRVTYHDPILLINSINLIESVADISSILRAAGAVIQSMTMRENTLEDVFIHLTGRNLRQ